MAACTHCGKELRPGDKFCQYCGQQVTAESSGEPAYVAAAYSPMSSPQSYSSPQSRPAPTPAAPSTPLGSSAASSAGQARLVVRISPTAEPGAVVDDGEREFVLDGRDIAIGRAPSCDIVLAGDQLASRRHALLRSKDGGYTIVDLGSSNGTYINDQEIHAETPLQDGDRITIGGHDLLFSASPASPSASVPGMNIAPTQSSTPLLETAPSLSAVNLPGPGAAPETQPDAQMEAGAPPEPEAGQNGHAAQSGGLDGGTFIVAAPMEGEAAAPAESEPAAVGTEAPAAEADQGSDLAAAESPEMATVAAVPEGDAIAAPEAGEVVPAQEEEELPEQQAQEQPIAQATAEAQPAATLGASMDGGELDALRAQLAEVSTALARRADEEYRLAGRLRAALVEVRDQLASLLRDHGGGSYEAGTPAPRHDYSELVSVARQAAENPIEHLTNYVKHAGDIADALDAAQSAQGASGDQGELLAGIEALKARLDETLG